MENLKKKNSFSSLFFFFLQNIAWRIFFFFISPTNFTITAVNFSSVLVVGKTELYRKICCDTVIVYTILFVLIRDPAIPLYLHFPLVLAIPSLLTFCSNISLYLIFHYLSPPLSSQAVKKPTSWFRYDVIFQEKHLHQKSTSMTWLIFFYYSDKV